MILKRSDIPSGIFGTATRRKGKSTMSQAEKLASEFSGPILFDYVWWVLVQAQIRGIKKLYFLARDGYTLKRIADLFCERFQLNISTEYLYCSRASFRMPTYHLIGEEAFDLLLQRGYRVTPKSVLQRAELSGSERRAIYEDCGIEESDEDQLLTHQQFDAYARRLKKSRLFRKYLYKKSTAAYQSAVGYLRQEGLFDQKIVAIVDSGWTGSMQRSLRQIMEFDGYCGKFIGFYFGMFALPKTAADGTYLTWYFDAEYNVRSKVNFCNNLFECLLAAPHGMTKGYRFSNRRYEPILNNRASEAELSFIRQQSDCICEYAQQRLSSISFQAFPERVLQKDTRKRLKRYMVYPTREEAAYYGHFLFCDDVTEAYHAALADDSQKTLLEGYSMVRRVFRRFFRHTPRQAKEELYWPYGVIAFLPAWKRAWWRWNIRIWETLKYTLHRAKPISSFGTDLEEIRRLVDRADVGSFDVFDTLLYRVVNIPTDVFRVMEPVIQEKTGLDGFAEKRIAAEQLARKVPGREEVTLRQIYDALSGITPEICDFLMAYEQETERRLLRRDEAMADLLAYCASSGKRVLVISDMYHSSNFIGDVLRAFGICLYDSLYVSADENATKASGALFLKVEQEEKLCGRKNWLHIGDNAYSDYTIPQALGIMAVRYDNGRYPAQTEQATLRTVLRRVKWAIKRLSRN